MALNESSLMRTENRNGIDLCFKLSKKYCVLFSFDLPAIVNAMSGNRKEIYQIQVREDATVEYQNRSDLFSNNRLLLK